MNTLKSLSGMIDRLNQTIGIFVSWISLLLVAVVFVDVIMRYLFNISFVFTQELEWHLFAFIFLIGSGFTLFHDGHVRVDIFYQRLTTRGQAWVNFLGVIFFLIPGCILIIVTSLPWIWESIKVWECSPDPGGIPLRFILKSCVPIGFVLLLLQGFSLGIKSLLVLKGLITPAEEN